MTEFFLKLMVVTSLLLVPVIYMAWGPSTVSIQRGYEGVGMDHVYNRKVLGDTYKANQAPVALPMADPEGERSAVAYKNVKVLGGISTGQFNRLMISMTQWVAGEAGCNYCHNPNNMASDEKYTKHVARRMLQMTQNINENWTQHVAETGVTCYTCHRGQPVPQYIWFTEPMNKRASGEVLLGNDFMQNHPGENVTLASLPNDPFTPFLEKDMAIRVVGKMANPMIDYKNRNSIKKTEWTYGLMIHMSNALGVNCTYCHNSRAMAEWAQSPPARTTAWYGIRMVREINNEYTTPLLEYYPDYRKGPLGDAPKANCMTCHQGAYKPVLGAKMAKDFPSLQKSTMYVPPPDSDNDGMLDKDDGCPNDPETVNNFRDSDGCSDIIPDGLEGIVGFVDGVEFLRDSNALTADARSVLKAAASVLKVYPDLKVEIRLYSVTAEGEDVAAVNALAKERVETVKSYLVGRGLNEENITTATPGALKDGATVSPTGTAVEFYIE